MKTLKRFAIMICCCMIAFVFTACGSSGKSSEDNALAQFAGEYTFYCMDIMDYHVSIEELAGTTTTLEEDGSGYLNWGEDNKGPISEWTVDDAAAGAVTIKAGVSTMKGTIKDGILRIEMADKLTSVYVLDGTDTSGIETITPDQLPADLLKELFGE